MEIKLEEVDKLYIHEEIVKETLYKLVETIKVDKRWLHPIISARYLQSYYEKLVKYLSKKPFKRLPAGQIIDRRYEEELFIFE